VRIVLVDDDPSFGAIVTEFLAEEGHDVRWVMGHAEALQDADARDTDVYLLDGFGRDATELTETHRALLQALGARAPVILCSAHLWARLMPAEEIGVAAVLPKPFELDALLRLLATVSQRSVH
jgi:DNA-binding response OmpR family regulator